MACPSEIRKLDEVVVNRIAAGEVIQRPASALKEMIENSLDAKSNNIQITVKSGGLKYLQIQDNGTGIRKEDMEIVCERFTTSKLQKFEDLQSIGTYGFRGEALASISHVARLTIQTKTANSKCAYRASYEDGKLKSAPKPCAGNQGTQITVEDLFYNVSTRLQAFKSPAEEYQKICDVVTRYAIHNYKVGFTLKKFGENNEIKTPPNSTCVDNIRNLYGFNIASHLTAVNMDDANHGVKVEGYITNVNFSAKKGIFLLFINHRLVESTALRKALVQVYSLYLPKNSSPFIYLRLDIDSHLVDVNVHPTKHEVHFLHEEEIIERIKTTVETKLLECNMSRVFYTQARLPGSSVPKLLNATKPEEASNKSNQKEMVRRDHNDQTIHKYFGTSDEINTDEGNTGSPSVVKVKDIIKVFKTHKSLTHVDTKITSVLTLRKEIEDDGHTELKNILSSLIYVGFIDAKKSLIQHDTKLYLCNTVKLCDSLFYELLLYNFGNLASLILDSGLCIRDLAILALQSPESGWTAEYGTQEECANKIQDFLVSKAPLLLDHFSMEIDIQTGKLLSLPLVLVNYLPSTVRIPMYMVRLVTEVNWESEKECFDTFCKETARFFSLALNDLDTGTCTWITEHVVYPALKKHYIPMKAMAENGCILQIANLPDLYKVFERC